MDLNLYLGPPRSPRPQSSDLGSDLALSSLPLSMSSSTEESHAPLEISNTQEPIDSHAPYSPSHASFFGPELGGFNEEYDPYSSSYEPYGPILPESEEHDSPDSAEFSVHLLPTIQESEEALNTPSYIHQLVDPEISVISLLRAASPLPSVFPLRNLSTLNVPPVQPCVSMYAPPVPSYGVRSPSYSPPSHLYPPRSSSYVPPRGGDQLLGRDNESGLRQELFDSPTYRLRRSIESARHLQDCPAYRFRRSIESARRLQPRMFRSSLPHNGSEWPEYRERISRYVSTLSEQQATHGFPPLPVPEQGAMSGMMSSPRQSETDGENKVPVEGVGAEGSEEEKEDNGNMAANFECNICLDMAHDPVVTSCGHLFCWPCLYQWLYIHSEHKECPVCKGEVSESGITPIYGRGRSGAIDGQKPAEGGESNVKIPPRPHGSRSESFGAISGRFGEGLSASSRRLVNQELRVLNRSERHAGLTSLRARRMLSDELLAEIGPEAEETRLPRDNTSVLQSSGEGFDPWNHPSTGLRRTRRSNDMRSLLGVNVWHRARDSSIIPRSSDGHSIFRNGTEPWLRPRENMSIQRNSNTNPLFTDRAHLWHRFNALCATVNADRHGASTSSVNPTGPEHVNRMGNGASSSVADQVSASSTTAVIQGDTGPREGSTEPGSAGSSRSFRRRGWSNASGSLDADGDLHARKRQRPN